MGKIEFIIALTDHRFLGKIFQPFFIEKKEKFYSVVRLVKSRELKDTIYPFNTFEKRLVEIIEKYSDEALAKRFSRAKNVSEFYASLNKSFFEKHVTPFIEQKMYEVVSVLMLSPVRLLKKDAKYSNLYDEDEIVVPPIFAKPVFSFHRNKTLIRYQLKVYLENNEINLQSKALKVVTNDPCLVLYHGKLLVFEKINAKRLLPFFEKESVDVPVSIEEKYFSGFVLNTIRRFNVQAEGFEIINSDAEKKAILSFEQNLQYRPVFVLKFEYGNERFGSNSSNKVAVDLKKKNGTFVFQKTIRDFTWEESVIRIMKSLRLHEEHGFYSLKGMDLLETAHAFYYLVNWLNNNKQKLEKKGIWLEQKKLEKKYFTGKQELTVETKVKGDWFDVYAVVNFGEFQIPFIKLKKYILNDVREFELPNGEIAILPEEWFARYKGILPFIKQKGENIHLEKHHFTLLHDLIRETDKSLFQKFNGLSGKQKEVVALPQRLKAKLRSYQHEGFQWMFALYKNGMGGCLADDMGLGKTLQTLTLLLKLKREKQNIKVKNDVPGNTQLNIFTSETEMEESLQPASLIIVPTSLVHNWENEIKKFTPSLHVYKHIGSQRKKAGDLENIAHFYDIILTTYGTVRNDSEYLKNIDFFYLILDESQSVKNSASKTYKAVISLRAKNRLVITGTPIENSLSDLWSQLNFLNPGLLGNMAFFRRWFITPIEKHGNEEQQSKLQVLIRPFILRRKKVDVAKDLPPLMEEVRVCPMETEQQRMYEKEKSVIRNTILSAIEKDGINKSQFVVLQGLTKLRQLANHPSLLEKNAVQSSGKFEEIFRMLENLIAENHKVLIFSSFVTHLELLENRIINENWKFSKLTGQTANRKKVIEEFQNNSENRIFLISLKAGGVGLNLTQADYVFIIDPWWNPAAENQAINRAHRIGQDKHVFVYRFITENSIEEKIQKLKDRKSSLADKFINSNNPFEKITQEEIVDLFK